jgi:SHS family lactate transporter-like MFS transporter
MTIKALEGWTRDHTHAVTASYLAWTMDAFDFFILVFVLGDIAKEFHTKIPAVALSVTLTLAMRPVGAFFFGRLADRYGRRPILMKAIVYRDRAPRHNAYCDSQSARAHVTSVAPGGF